MTFPERFMSSHLTTIHFRLNLSREKTLSYYQGMAQTVLVYSDDGRRIALPAQALRPFVSLSGISGHFSVSIDQHNKLQNLIRLSD